MHMQETLIKLSGLFKIENRAGNLASYNKTLDTKPDKFRIGVSDGVGGAWVREVRTKYDQDQL